MFEFPIRHPRGAASRSRGVLVVLVLVGCGETPDRHPFGGTAPVGTIGSGPADVDEDPDDDSSGGTSTSDASSGGPNDDTADDAADDSAPAMTTMPSDPDTGSGDPVLDACLDLAVDACQMCACNLCLDPLYACQQDPGCVAMRDCAEQTGCAGVDCLEPCGAVVDMYGGPFGESGTRALALSDCLSASCAVCF